MKVEKKFIDKLSLVDSFSVVSAFYNSLFLCNVVFKLCLIMYVYVIFPLFCNYFL